MYVYVYISIYVYIYMHIYSNYDDYYADHKFKKGGKDDNKEERIDKFSTTTSNVHSTRVPKPKVPWLFIIFLDLLCLFSPALLAAMCFTYAYRE
jgi:hypothetical protein